MGTLSTLVLATMATMVVGCGDGQEPAKDASSAQTDAEVRGERGSVEEYDSADAEDWDRATEQSEEEYNEVDEGEADMVNEEDGYAPLP